MALQLDVEKGGVGDEPRLLPSASGSWRDYPGFIRSHTRPVAKVV
jgi:hypothetical protein